MSEDPMFREAEFLKAGESLPHLSPGLRSRVLAAALEAQDRRAQGRRVLVSALGLFAMLGGVAWLGPFASESLSPVQFANKPILTSPLFDGDVPASSASSPYFDGVSGKLLDGTTAGTAAGKKAASAAASSALSSFGRGQGLMSLMGDDWRSVEDQLRSRQEHFPRFQM